MKVKVFNEVGPCTLEREINSFLLECERRDVKVHGIEFGGCAVERGCFEKWTAMVITE